MSKRVTIPRLDEYKGEGRVGHRTIIGPAALQCAPEIRIRVRIGVDNGGISKDNLSKSHQTLSYLRNVTPLNR